MKLDSKYFDSIRIASRKAEVKPPIVEACQWKGCGAPGAHRAPRGRGRDGDYLVFCIDHVRQFNASYNYFQGMSDDEVADFQKSALTGHRPTWKLGENGTQAPNEAPPGEPRHSRFGRKTSDPHDFLGGAGKKAKTDDDAPRRVLKSLERKALEAMHLPETAGKSMIKARFKELVKRHHPDANGGDTGSEEKLREIIQAYNYLKQAGLV